MPQPPPQGAGDVAGAQGGMAALHDAMQRTYQALQQALTGPLQGHGQPSQVPVQGQGLLGPLSLGAGPGPHGGFLGVPWTNEGLTDAQLLTKGWKPTLLGSWTGFLRRLRAPIAGSAWARAMELANGG